MSVVTVGLVNGKYITIDEKDYDWVSSEEWRWVVRKTNKGTENIFIESINEKWRYLHNLFFPKRSKHSRIEFANGDPFDYRRPNVFSINMTYGGKRRRYRARNEPIVRVIKLAPLGVIENRCVIAPTSTCYRSLLCAVCSTVDDGKYEECLDIAANGNWNGWKPIKMGPWCKWLNAKINTERTRQNENREI